MAFKITLYIVLVRLKNCLNRKLGIVDQHSTYSVGNFFELEGGPFFFHFYEIFTILSQEFLPSLVDSLSLFWSQPFQLIATFISAKYSLESVIARGQENVLNVFECGLPFLACFLSLLANFWKTSKQLPINLMGGVSPISNVLQ